MKHIYVNPQDEELLKAILGIANSSANANQAERQYCIRLARYLEEPPQNVIVELEFSEAVDLRTFLNGVYSVSIDPAHYYEELYRKLSTDLYMQTEKRQGPTKPNGGEDGRP